MIVMVIRSGLFSWMRVFEAGQLEDYCGGAINDLVTKCTTSQKGLTTLEGPISR